ncbi:hypothetical protein [Piscirickettsia litoralis]|uniref:Lipoprotein n=1 Tax=Piscirickettsia litoralis TaxID=1891921 RepID=A0ABX3A1Y5_9GAMM|nr:hypothetical protein [Piscirickettsia litoralis]ODN42247.1 hypothetical protein BGC07_03975 [Piscirickettsia litoralis]
MLNYLNKYKNLAILVFPIVLAGCATTSGPQHKTGLSKCGKDSCYIAPLSEYGTYYTNGMSMQFKVPKDYLTGKHEVSLEKQTNYNDVSPSPYLQNQFSEDVNTVWLMRFEPHRYVLDTSVSVLYNELYGGVELIMEGLRDHLDANFKDKGVHSVQKVEQGYRYFGDDCMTGYILVRRLYDDHSQNYALETETSCSMGDYVSKIETFAEMVPSENRDELMKKVFKSDKAIAVSMKVLSD